MSFPIDFTVNRKVYYGLFNDLILSQPYWALLSVGFEEVIVRTYTAKTIRVAVSSLEGGLSSRISIVQIAFTRLPNTP